MPAEKCTITIESNTILKGKIDISAQTLGTDAAGIIEEAVNIFFRKLVTDGKIPMEATYSFLKDAEEETGYSLDDSEARNDKYRLTLEDKAKFGKAQLKNADKAEQGDSKAQNVIGTYYESGNGAPKDYDRAIYWYTKAAEQGNTNAQYHLGVLYNKAKNNPLMAYMWFEVARICGFNITAIHKDYIMRLTDNLSTRQMQEAQDKAEQKVKEIQQRGK